VKKPALIAAGVAMLTLIGTAAGGWVSCFFGHGPLWHKRAGRIAGGERKSPAGAGH